MTHASPPPEDPPSRSADRSLMLVLAFTLLMGTALLTWVAFGRPVPGLAKETAGDPNALAPRATVDRFDGPRAFRLLERQVNVYGERPAGSENLRRLGDDLVRRLPGGHFEDVPGGLRNVVGSLPGKGAPIVLGAHYDSAAIKGFVGANDGAGGVAALVEIARQLGAKKRPANAPPIRFVLFDGEELPAGAGEEADFEAVALRGSKVEARHLPKPRAMILLDYIAERRGFRLPRERNSDTVLWTRLRKAAGQVGTKALFPSGDAVAIIDDHVPFLRAGVPSIDLIDFDYPQTHTPQDDLAHVSERSLDAVGETVLQLLRTW